MLLGQTNESSYAKNLELRVCAVLMITPFSINLGSWACDSGPRVSKLRRAAAFMIRQGVTHCHHLYHQGFHRHVHLVDTKLRHDLNMH